MTKVNIIVVAVVVVLGGVAYFLSTSDSDLGAVPPVIFSTDDVVTCGKDTYRIAYDTTDNGVINDFQSKAQEGTLIKNAVTSGKNRADVLEVCVNRSNFNKYRAEYREFFRPQREAEQAAKEASVQNIENKLNAFSEEELLQLEDAILHGIRFSNNPTQ